MAKHKTKKSGKAVWSVRRAYGDIGGWISHRLIRQNTPQSLLEKCLAYFKNFRTFSCCSRAVAMKEALKQNASEVIELKEDELVVAFKVGGNKGKDFLVGRSETHAKSGWVLCNEVPVWVRCVDVCFHRSYSTSQSIGQGRVHHNIRRIYSEDKFFSFHEYRCFDLDNLPNNVMLLKR